MAVRIGHASKDERGKFTGGAAGDQTGKEVCIRSWYNGGWGFVARPISGLVAEAIAVSCEKACGNPAIGYDQSGRNTGLQQAQRVNWDLSKVTEPCEFDCSSLATACIQAAGVKVWDGGNAMTTGSMKRKLEATGAFQILTEEKYLTGPTYLKRGDILCKPGSHVVIVLDDGPNAAQIQPVPKADTVTVYYSVRLPMLHKGSKGPAVERMQALLLSHGEKLPRYGADGDFGTETGDALESFQRKHNLKADRKCGPESWAALITT